jgi:hypothetical protein
MKFLCLAYYDEEKFAGMSPNELTELVQACRAHDQELRATGNLLSSGSLESPAAARVARPVSGTVQVTDGPFAETKEQVGGVFLIEAPNMEEATRIASLHPAARMGAELGWAVEIRGYEQYEG